MIAEPEILYHYTSLDVLLKIISSRQLWATSIGYLNDSSERLLYQSKAKLRLPGLLAAHADVKTVVDPGEQPPGAPWDLDVLSTFVTSFTQENNSLSQWRAYTPSGLGVQIGFKAACLKGAKVSYTGFESIHPTNFRREFKPTFGRVMYIDRINPEIDDVHLLREYELAVEDFIRKQQDGTAFGRFDSFLEKRLGAIGCMFKDASFRAENEFRLVIGDMYWPYVPLYFRTAKATLVPYLKLDIPRSDGMFTATDWDAIDSITVGPTPNEKLTTPAIAALLFSRQLKVRQVANSGIPYRDL